MSTFTPRKLPPLAGGLAGKSLPAPPGSVFVFGHGGGFVAPPVERIQVRFGRLDELVEVCVGPNDERVSRQHGRIVRAGREWWLHNDGVLPIRLPRSTFLLSGEQLPLPEGYSPLFIRGDRHHEHLLEVRVVGATRPGPAAEAGARTRVPETYPLADTERLVLTALAQRYLRQESHPQPVSWKQVAEDLNDTRGQSGWHPHRAANVVGAVRARLSAAGVPGLTLAEVGDPAGNMLNHNLIQELLQTATLLPPDLRLLGEGEGEG